LAVIKDDPECLAMFRDAMNGTLAGHGGNHKSERVNQDQDSATTLNGVRDNDYWQARIQRDCPEELAVIKDDPECLAMFRDAMKEHHNQHTRKDNNVIQADTPQGNSRAYSIDRRRSLHWHLVSAGRFGALRASGCGRVGLLARIVQYDSGAFGACFWCFGDLPPRHQGNSLPLFSMRFLRR
jgi:hypothetical protein